MSNDLFRNKYRIPSARADWHDYNIGYYFITICTDKRIHYFGEIINVANWVLHICFYVAMPYIKYYLNTNIHNYLQFACFLQNKCDYQRNISMFIHYVECVVE